MTPSAPRITEISVRSAILGVGVGVGLGPGSGPPEVPAAPMPSTPRLPVFPPPSARKSAPVLPAAAVPPPGPALPTTIVFESAARSTVAPVTATLPPAGVAFPQVYRRRPYFSADSKILAAGGGLAVAMLVLAVTFWVSRQGGPATPARVFPVVVEAKPIAMSPTVAANNTPFMPVIPTLDLNAPTIDVQQLPQASRPHVRAPLFRAAAAAARRPQTAAATASSGATPLAVDDEATSTPEAPEAVASIVRAPAPPPPTASTTPVDPLVQAVREDIREDESRAK